MTRHPLPQLGAQSPRRPLYAVVACGTGRQIGGLYLSRSRALRRAAQLTEAYGSAFPYAVEIR